VTIKANNKKEIKAFSSDSNLDPEEEIEEAKIGNK
jgi:hypothetical protein